MLFDNGAGTLAAPGSTTPVTRIPRFEQSFPSWPIPGTTARSWYLGPNGTLTDTAAGAAGVDTYTSTPPRLPLTDYGSNTGGGGLWGNASQWDWTGSRTRPARRCPTSARRWRRTPP